MARKDLKVGQQVRYLRMSNKAVSLMGTIKQLNPDDKTVLVESDEGFAENAHVDDLVILESAKKQKDGKNKEEKKD